MFSLQKNALLPLFDHGGRPSLHWIYWSGVTRARETPENSRIDLTTAPHTPSHSLLVVGCCAELCAGLCVGLSSASVGRPARWPSKWKHAMLRGIHFIHPAANQRAA